MREVLDAAPARSDSIGFSSDEATPYAIFAMAGKSSRFLDAGYGVPKYLLAIGSVPMFYLSAIPFEADGFENYFICNQEALLDSNLRIRREISRWFPGSKILSTPKNNLGPSYSFLHSDLSNLDLSRPAILSYTDAFSSFSPANLVTRLREEKAEAAAVVFKGSHHPASQLGNAFAYLKTRGIQVEAVSEKIPFTEQPSEEYASTGVYAFRNLETMIFAMEKQMEDGQKYNGEFYTSLSLNSLVQRDRKVIIYETDYFIDVGTPNSYEEFRRNAAIHSSSIIFGNKDASEPRSELWTTIVLGAGRGTRFKREGYSSEKPNLRWGATTILDNLYRQTVMPLRSGKVVFAISERVKQEWSTLELEQWCDRGTVSMVAPNRSSIETLKVALDGAPEQQGFHVLACDMLVDVSEVLSQTAKESSEEEGFFLWVGRPTSISRKTPELFSWVELDDDGNVSKVLVKQGPDFLENPLLVLGCFSYSGSSIQLMRELNELLESSPGPEELHVEDLVLRRLQKGERVTGILVQDFINVGTPVELSHAEYYKDFLTSLSSSAG